MFRHGDVLIAPVPAIPEGATPQPECILARGEVTGHSHRVAEPGAAVLLEHRGNLFLDVRADFATVVHEEHKPIRLARGLYRVWRQREYSPEALRTVRD